MYWLQLGIWHT